MVYLDQTGALQSLIAEGSKEAASSAASPRGPSPNRARQRRQAKTEDDGFLKEAYQIVSLIVAIC